MSSIQALRRAALVIPDSLKRDIKVALGVPNVETALLNMKHNGFAPKTVIDVGAYIGEWTTLCKRVFPSVKILMIEPQPALKFMLEKIAARSRDLSFQSSLLGTQQHESIPFYQNETASSVLPSHGQQEFPAIALPMTTLDSLTEQTDFAHPDFLKLDVQGFELHVLRGASRALASAEAALMEVNLLEIYEGAPLLAEVVAFMTEHAFQVYDVCTFIRRPYDGALWQLDMVFVKQSSPLVASKTWS